MNPFFYLIAENLEHYYYIYELNHNKLIKAINNQIYNIISNEYEY